MGDDANTTTCHLPILRLKTRSDSEDVHYPVVYEGFPEEFKTLAEKELRETEEKKMKGLQMLNDHIQRENLHVLPDYLLLAILRVSKYDTKRSKSKLEKFLIVRKQFADMLAKTGLKKTEVILDNFSCGILPYRDKHGRVIFYTRPDGFEFNLHSVDDVASVGFTIFLFILQFPITTVSGFAYLIECKHPSISYICPIVNTFRRVVLHPFSMPLRVSKLDVLNPVAATHWFYKILRPLLSQKVVKRVQFYSQGYDGLLKEYSKSILPEEFGGNAGTLQNSYYRNRVLEFAKKLLEEYKK